MVQKQSRDHLLYRKINNTVAAIGSSSIDDTDVREGRLIVNISLAENSGFRLRSAMPALVSIGVASTGVRDPRSFPTVVNTADVVCRFAPPAARDFIVCAFPASPEYTLRASESLVVSCIGTGVSPVCTDSPWTLSVITVRPSSVDTLKAVFQVASAIATGVAIVVVMVLGDGTPFEIQVMIVLLNGACASDVDRDSVVLVRYFVSPFINRGWSWVIVDNVCIAAGFAFLHSCLVLIIFYLRASKPKEIPIEEGPYSSGNRPHERRQHLTKEQRLTILRDAATGALYPGLSLLVCRVVYIGIAYATFDVLRATRGAGETVSALGLVYLIMVPSVDVYLLRQHVVVAYISYKNLGCLPARSCPTWLCPQGVWGPTADVRRYFGLIGPYRAGYRYAGLTPLCLSLLIAMMMSALTETISCDYLFVGAAIACLVAGVVAVMAHPSRSRVQSSLSGVCLISVGILAVLQIISIRHSSVSTEAVKSALNYTVVTMTIMRSCHNIFVTFTEWKWANEVGNRLKATDAPPGCDSRVASGPNAANSLASSLDRAAEKSIIERSTRMVFQSLAGGGEGTSDAPSTVCSGTNSPRFTSVTASQPSQQQYLYESVSRGSLDTQGRMLDAGWASTDASRNGGVGDRYHDTDVQHQRCCGVDDSSDVPIDGGIFASEYKPSSSEVRGLADSIVIEPPALVDMTSSFSNVVATLEPPSPQETAVQHPTELSTDFLLPSVVGGSASFEMDDSRANAGCDGRRQLRRIQRRRSSLVSAVASHSFSPPASLATSFGLASHGRLIRFPAAQVLNTSTPLNDERAQEYIQHTVRAPAEASLPSLSLSASNHVAVNEQVHMFGVYSSNSFNNIALMDFNTGATRSLGSLSPPPSQGRVPNQNGEVSLQSSANSRDRLNVDECVPATTACAISPLTSGGCGTATTPRVGGQGSHS